MMNRNVKRASILFVLVLGGIHPIFSTDPIKVLVDESRIDMVTNPEQWMIDILEAIGVEFEEIEDPRCSFENTVEGFGFGTAAERLRSEFSLSLRKSGRLDYSTLKKYDVLVITSFSERYSSQEAEAIRQFVENGGGLFLAADYSAPNNSVSAVFDVSFPSNINILDKNDKSSSNWRIYIDEFGSHPITEGIDQILLDDGVPIDKFEYGEVLVRTSETSWANRTDFGAFYDEDAEEKKGPFDVVLAQSVGEGRTVIFGGSDSFINSVVDEDDQQNLDFLVNAIRWLGEPGGPYRQYAMRNQQAQQLMSEATSLFDSHSFSAAKKKFQDVIDLYTESNEIYANVEAQERILEAEKFSAYCETGMEADTLFDGALGLYQERHLEDAVAEFERAQSLYRDISYEARVSECSSQIEECQRLMTVQEEAASLFSQGQTALETGSSGFSAAGYEKAQSLFEQARSRWQEYGDESKVADCDERIAECEKGISAVSRNRIVLGGIIAAVVLVGVVFVVVVKRRKKPESE
ncbi:MAG: hypothetical protein HXS52_02720 [Theionarchaea archaeon]|nr:hypothetical protein [Theionarchaea archaeon]MBU7036818.1 hypothetical protein [Theionarchaea archaeon]